MYGLIVGIIIFLAILLILIVLVQNPKGGGLSSNFSSSNQFMGVKKTADFIEKATWGFASAIVVLCIVATMIPHKTDEAHQSRIQEQIENTAIDPGLLPSYPTTPTEESPVQDEQTQE